MWGVGVRVARSVREPTPEQGWTGRMSIRHRIMRCMPADASPVLHYHKKSINQSNRQHASAVNAGAPGCQHTCAVVLLHGMPHCEGPIVD